MIPQAQIPNYSINQPPAPDLLGQYGKLLSLKNMQAQSAEIPLDLQIKQQQVQQQQALNPLQLQQQQEATKQAQLATQQAQLQIKSQNAMIDAISGGALNKYAGVSTPDGSGFDAAGAYQDLVANHGVLPQEAGAYVQSIQSVAKNNADIRKNLGDAGEAFLKNRTESHKQMASDVADVLALPPAEQPAALNTLKQSYAAKPLPGVDANDLALFQQADPAHLPAVAAQLRLDSLIDAHHAEQAQEQAQSAEAGQKVRAASPVTPELLQSATQTLGTFAAMPPNMRQAFAKQMSLAPDYQSLQDVQKRAEDFNKAFQSSADARQQAMTIKDVGLQQVVAGKLVAEDQKLGAIQDQTDGIRGLLDLSKGGNETANNAALTRFAEHEIREGGINRMNQAELNNLTKSVGDYGRRISAWVDAGFKGEIPPATNAEIGSILDAEETAANAAHDRNVGFINDRYTAPATATAAPPAATNKGGAGKGSSTTIYARDPNGKLHAAPAGTALPAGWTKAEAPK